MSKKEKSFDVMKWIREVRDNMYEETKHLSTHERFQKISEKAEHIEAERKLKEKTKVKI